MQYTLRNYTKKTFNQQELLDLQDKGVDFVGGPRSSFCRWNFDSEYDVSYSVHEDSMELFLSLVEESKEEAAEEPDGQFPAFVPLTAMQLKVVERGEADWSGPESFSDFLEDVQEYIYNEIIEEMKQEARRKAEEENDYVIVDTGTTFEYDQRKFAFVQVGVGKYKIFQVQDGKIGWNRYFDEEFQYHQKVKISSLFKT